MHLPFEKIHEIEKLSRYLGGEIGSVVKDDANVRLNVALAFPDIYEIGMSHTGLKILYGLINRREDFRAERVMAPWPDLEAEIRDSGQGLRSLESGRLLRDFDVVGFSLQYELTYTNVLNMMELGGISLMTSDRGQDEPLVIGGGPNAYNPEPLADYFDLFYLGDAEAGLMDILETIAVRKKSGADRSEILEELAGRPGIYIPSFFKPEYDESGRLQIIHPLRPGYDHVERVVAPNLDRCFYPDQPVVPFTRAIHDRLAVEIARGCTRGCRFCQAGFIYRPVRERRPDTILDLAAEGLASTGMDEASFLALSAGDYTCLPQIMTAFMDAHGPKSVALSLPSLRVKSLSTGMMEQIKRVRKTGFTLAPEAGTQRLRDVINKDLTEDDLINASREAFRLGWRLIKLYFMIGLPTETEEDILAISDLARKIRPGRGQVNVSFAVFVPKPHTPFQWEPMLDPDTAKARMNILKSRLRGPGLKPKWNEVESSLVEGVLSRGDRRLGPVIRKVQARGGRFDAWGDQIRLNLWLDALTEEGLTTDEYLRARHLDEILPWQHLRTGTTPEYLKSQRENAFLGQTTPDCRDGACGACGVCDFMEIKPRLCESDLPPIVVSAPVAPTEKDVRWRINYAKVGPARFLSHLETVSVILRALRRTGIWLKMSEGFHPQPRISFATPLPVGLASEDEYLDVRLLSTPPKDEFRRRLESELPEGLIIKSAAPLAPNSRRLVARGSRFRIETAVDIFDADVLSRQLEQDHLWISKKGKKGVRQIDVKLLAADIRVLTPRLFEITLMTGPTGSVRPLEAAAVLFDLTPDRLSPEGVVKLETLIVEE